MVSLRELTTNDVEWITRACQDVEILRWTLVPRPYTIDHARNFVADHAGEVHAWAIADDSTTDGLGVIGVHRVVDGTAHVGYWVASWARRRAVATNALKVLCEELASWSHVRQVSATIATTNEASRRTAERAGFTLDTAPSPDTCPDGDCQVPSVVYLRTVTMPSSDRT